MRGVLLFLCSLWVLAGCGRSETQVDATMPPRAPNSGTPAVQAKEEPLPVEDFVAQRHPHGVPYDDAKSYGAEAVPTLITMLQNPAEEENLPNIVATLGAIGDERATIALIQFVDQTEGEVSIHRFDALLSVNSALGQIAAARPQGSAKVEGEALDFLLDHSSVTGWRAEQLRWSYGRYRGDTLHTLMTELSTNGLGLSGNDQAYTRLQQMREAPESPSLGFILRDNVNEALKTNRAVKAQGLESLMGEVQ